VLAAIPYTTFPTIGPIRTFGLMVGVGVLLGSWIAGRYIEERAGIDREESYRMATRLVVAGIIGARITFVLSHLEDMHSIVDPFAVWEGGLQFSGGFAGAIVFGIPFFKRWDKRQRWIALDGYAYGLSLGLAIGRIGCYSVGEHFGSLSSFPLAVRYDGGSVREATIGAVRLEEGMTFHQTALYEGLYLLVLFGILAVVVRRGARPATAMAIFCTWYGSLRFLTDFLRVNDEQVLGLTGAQYLMAIVALAGVWVWFWVRPSVPAPDEVTVTAPFDDEPVDAEVDER
jgi:phosphatidylglycerol:prolipoprotein diacylglycerol transferase